ncbi:MAG: prepilin-type N-terminal cleavage/methylation domain-containing protein [Planctomycetes bacterium]|nr:prepilin-type N-terminal cleavage/methylation domain-containing protein [Planctomycetota bacterium]
MLPGTQTPQRVLPPRPGRSPAARPFAARTSTLSRPGRIARGFTLVEMVIVVAIVLVLLTAILPAALALWENRKSADAVNTLQGMLMTARARATQPNATQTGLYFFVDPIRSVQRIVFIEQDAGRVDRPAWQNVFRVSEDPGYELPAPMRVAPRYVVMPDGPGNGDDPVTFNDVELAHNDFTRPPPPPPTPDHAQRHRNFFAMVFANDGQLLVRRDVLIMDEYTGPSSPPPLDILGDRTGLEVGYDLSGTGKPTVKRYYPQTGPAATIDPTTGGGTTGPEAIPFLVIDAGVPQGDVAMNFPSVDGLLLYDDYLFNGLPAGNNVHGISLKREFLIKTGIPFYVNRLSGAVIRGPVGETL